MEKDKVKEDLLNVFQSMRMGLPFEEVLRIAKYTGEKLKTAKIKS